jgi:L-rhamnose isomerase/sugar isomerase
MLQTVDQLQQAYAKACLVDVATLAEHQASGDVIMAERTLKRAYETDVRPLVAEARQRRGGALDPVAAFRASGYRAQKTVERS